LKPAIRNKQRRLLSETCLAPWQSCPPCRCCNNRDNSKPEVWGSASEFRVFGSLKEELHGRWFGSDEVKEVMHKWITEQPKTVFSDGIRKLVDGYKKVCGTAKRLCCKIVELLCTLHFICG
jgi:hypothetical protein